MKLKSNELIEATKNCIICGAKFCVSYFPIGIGSANVLRKKYCSIECKNNTKTKSKIEKKCEVCSKSFLTFQSVNKKCCSQKCKGIAHRGERVLHIDRNCEFCGKQFRLPLNNTQKFCNPECFANSSKRRTILTCLVCSKEFSVKTGLASSRKHCSRKCQFHSQSSGVIKVNVSGRQGSREDLNHSDIFKSSYEADYMRWCNYNNIIVKYSPKTFVLQLNGKQKHYTPDFFRIEDEMYIELKGIRKVEGNKCSERINSNFESFLQLQSSGTKIEIIYMEDFYNSLRLSGQYILIPNLENRNYAATKCLIRKN